MVLTAGGLAALREAAPIHLSGVGEHFAGRLTRSDTEALITALKKLV